MLGEACGAGIRRQNAVRGGIRAPKGGEGGRRRDAAGHAGTFPGMAILRERAHRGARGAMGGGGAAGGRRAGGCAMTNARAGRRRAAGPSTALCIFRRGPGRRGGGQQRGSSRQRGGAGSPGRTRGGAGGANGLRTTLMAACKRRGALHAPPTGRAGWASEGALGRGGQRLPSCSTGWCEHWGAVQGRPRIRQPSVALAFVMAWRP